mgnify:CR=1 FL=1
MHANLSSRCSLVVAIQSLQGVWEERGTNRDCWKDWVDGVEFEVAGKMVLEVKGAIVEGRRYD